MFSEKVNWKKIEIHTLVSQADVMALLITHKHILYIYSLATLLVTPCKPQGGASFAFRNTSSLCDIDSSMCLEILLHV